MPAESPESPETLHLAESIGRLPAYGGAHLGMLALLLIAVLVLVPLVRRLPREPVERALRAYAWVLLAAAISWTAWSLLPGVWSLEESLPLHLSDALRFVLPVALLTRARWALAVAFYWGLTLNLQSVLTPDLNYFVSVPWEFAQYWTAHLSGVLVPVLLVWGLGYRPTWRWLAAAGAATLVWAGVAATGNLLAGTNYGYLSHAPAGPSILDLLGPWPWYLLVEATLIAGVWTLMTWPFARGTGRRRAPADPPQASSST